MKLSSYQLPVILTQTHVQLLSGSRLMYGSKIICGYRYKYMQHF